jgi:hypothetical protein
MQPRRSKGVAPAAAPRNRGDARVVNEAGGELPPMPHAAEAARRIIAYCDQEIERSEPPTAALLFDVGEKCRAFIGSRYPQHLPGD